MKIRNGFVSNSSSSSFIIAIKNGVNTLGKLQDYLFGNTTVYPNPCIWGEYFTTAWSVSDVAAVVYRDINKNPANTKEMIEVQCGGYSENRERAERVVKTDMGISENNIYDLERAELLQFYNMVDKLVKEYSSETINQFINDNPDHHFYIIEYSDNDGELFSAMEHGGLFDKIPHIRINNH